MKIRFLISLWSSTCMSALRADNLLMAIFSCTWYVVGRFFFALKIWKISLFIGYFILFLVSPPGCFKLACFFKNVQN